ncbi:hypothetical protein SLA_6150 [Streptomyces laurentii]|uniref:Restriction endonuclease type IV Mrr domain-containing protein n=1 Tax=Streptomyces laurentii TaxID=39478 RepID=A0A160P5I2_STRLU|nr:hypothetical protein SLA_6150 [Streptomyces laurentii]
MGDSVQVRCPECLRTVRYAAPAFPCVCGAPVAPALIGGTTAATITHRTWSDEWVTVRCALCSRTSDWPHPEVGCPCGAVLRVPVQGAAEPGACEAEPSAPGPYGHGAKAPDACTPDMFEPGVIEPGAIEPGRREPRGFEPDAFEYGAYGPGAAGPDGTGPDGPRPEGFGPEGSTTPADPTTEAPGTGPSASAATSAGPSAGPETHTADGLVPFHRRHPSPLPPHPGDRTGGCGAASGSRAVFRPVTIRTARDAVAASAGYLRWLGFRQVVQPEERATTAVDLRGPGLVAQVDPSTRPTGLRAVECLWLNGLSHSAVSVCFSLAGYTPEAHERAEGLGIPLFVLDLTGTPQPVNTHAGELVSTGAP